MAHTTASKRSPQGGDAAPGSTEGAGAPQLSARIDSRLADGTAPFALGDREPGRPAPTGQETRQETGQAAGQEIGQATGQDTDKTTADAAPAITSDPAPAVAPDVTAGPPGHESAEVTAGEVHVHGETAGATPQDADADADAATATAPAGDGIWREPVLPMLARRLVSIPALFLITVVYCALLPVLLAYALAADVVRRRPMLLARFHLAMVGLLLWHIFGLGALLLWWLAGLRWLGFRPRNWIEWNRRLEGWWGSHALGLLERTWNVRTVVSGDDQLAPGPVLVFARHTSVIDTMLPLRIVEHRRGMIARIVKKRELLWDPCVDSVSHRMPRAFVRRGSGDPAREVEHLRALVAGMGARDALWIYPEGTRFTPDKRERVLERLRERHPDAARRAERLRYTLPPRPAGALALLDDCPGMDVVFCAHTGMEPAGRLENLINGALLGITFKVQFWRVSAADIPASAEARVEWLHGWWERIDRWVADHRSAGQQLADHRSAGVQAPGAPETSGASRPASTAS